MAEELSIQDAGCELLPFERNRYFYGKLLATRDFETEQSYIIGKDRLINSHVHGAGIVCGLELTNPDVNNSVLFVDLTAGLGLDCCGREIIVSNAIANLRVRGNLQNGTNYIYLHYHECVKEPVPALANASTCEEVCCYNRIQESYEVRVSSDPPVITDATFTGIVSQPLINDATGPLPGARVEALQDGIVHASTLTSETGTYTLAVVAGTYIIIRASASGFQTASTAGTNVATGGTISIDEFILAPAASEPDAAMLCHEMTQQYYEERLRVCPQCDDPKVFLAVVENPPQGQVSLDVAATRRYREVVYSNPMLHALLCDHVADFHNPHHLTAADVLALQSVNNVGNTLGEPHVSNIDLVSSNSTIQITPQPDSQQINVTTSPANNVTSVGPTPVVGNSLSFAREDHVHDLAGEVVERDHLSGEDVIGGLLTSSDSSVTITPNVDNKTIDLQVQVESGSGISFINKVGPDESGNVFLTAGDNISIQENNSANEVIISATGSGIDVPSGRVIFEELNGQGEIRHSPLIPHGLPTEHVAIVMAWELPSSVAAPLFIGDMAQLFPEWPLFWSAQVSPEAFYITLVDRRPFGEGDDPPPPLDFIVRWWAIPKTQDREDVSVPPRTDDIKITPDELILARVAIQANLTAEDLAADLGDDPATLAESLNRMEGEGRITIDENKRISLQ